MVVVVVTINKWGAVNANALISRGLLLQSSKDGMLADTRDNDRLIYVSSGKKECCADNTRIQPVRKQGRTGDFQGSRVGGTGDPPENRVILRHKLR